MRTLYRNLLDSGSHRLSRENQPQGAGAARSASATGGVDLADPAGRNRPPAPDPTSSGRTTVGLARTRRIRVPLVASRAACSTSLDVTLEAVVDSGVISAAFPVNAASTRPELLRDTGAFEHVQPLRRQVAAGTS